MDYSGTNNNSGSQHLSLPHSIEAEQGLLGAILRNGEQISDVLEVLGNREKIFYVPRHQVLFNTCLQIYRTNSAIDWVTVKNTLSKNDQLDSVGGEEYIFDLIESAVLSVNVKEYTAILKEKATFRELIQVGQEVIEESYQAKELEKTIDTAQGRLYDVSQDKDARQLTSVSSISQTVWDDIEARSQSTNPLLGVDTGFRDLNHFTLGFQKSDFIVLAARPSMGKTAFCLNIAEHVGLKENKSVALFSLEMSKEQLLQRLIASHSEIDSQKLRTGKNLSEQDWDKMNMTIGELSNAPIYIDDSPSMSVMDIRSKARRLKAKDKDLGMIIIDYLQLMRGNNPNNRVQELSEISRGLKTLARELEVPVVALSQLSRGVESRQNKRPMLSDLRESGAIEQDADLVIFLYRHEYYEPEDLDERGVCEIIIAKQRNGPVATVKLRFHGATTRFYNLEQGH